MHSFLLIVIVVLTMLYGLSWHDKSAREPVRTQRTTSYLLWTSEADSKRRPIKSNAFIPRSTKSSHSNGEMFAIWSFVAISFTGLFFAGYVIWAKCRGQ